MLTAPKQPVYWRVATDLRRRIKEREWPVGGILPSIRDFARQYQTSYNPIQRAIATLIDEGLLRTEDKRGTFVTAATPLMISQDEYARENHGQLRGSVMTVGIISDNDTLTSEGIDAQYYTSWISLILYAVERALAGHNALQSQAYNHPDFCERVDAEPLLHDAINAAYHACITAALRDGCQGLVIIGIHDDEIIREYLERLLASLPVPVVYICNSPLRMPVPHICLEQRLAGYFAAEHLLHRGYRRLVFVSAVDNDWVRARMEGVKLAITRAGLPADTLQVHCVKQWVPWDRYGYDAIAISEAMVSRLPIMRELESIPCTPIGVIASCDIVAIAFQRAAARHGALAGSRYGLIGFDDSPSARALGITSMRPPFEELGALAGRMLCDVTQGMTNSMQIRLKYTLIPRRSTPFIGELEPTMVEK